MKGFIKNEWNPLKIKKTLTAIDKLGTILDNTFPSSNSRCGPPPSKAFFTTAKTYYLGSTIEYAP